MNSEKISRNIQSGLCLLLGLGFSVLGIIIIFQSMQCRKWPMAEGKIIHSFPVDAEDKPENKAREILKPYIVYEYAVNDRIYFSNNISTVDINRYFSIGESYYSGTEDNTKKILSQYPVDSKLKVYYNPQNPEMSVVDAGLKIPILIPFLFGLLMTYTAFHIFIYGTFYKTEEKREIF